MAGGFTGAHSQDLATILDPFRTTFADLEPDRLSETWTLCVETGQMSAVETGQMSEQQTSET